MNRPQNLTLAALLFACAGCAGIVPGNDPFVVRAEQSLQAAADTIDAFLLFERQNEALLWSIDHGIKRAADSLRDTFPLARDSAKRILRTYKGARTDANKLSLETALATLETLQDEAQRWLLVAKAGGAL